jgi:hypothetical protein
VTLRTQFSRIALAAAGLAAAAALVAPAGAADKPVPCAGYLLTDKAGDTNFDPTGQGAPGQAAPDNTDITGLFFNDENGKVTANIEIANLTKDVPPPTDSQAGIWYYVFYNYKGQARFVKAINRSGGDIEYRSGYLDDSSGALIVYATDPDPLTGSFHEGAKGVVSIELPAAIGGKDGETLGSASATVDYIQGPDDANGVNNRIDAAPDDGTPPNGKNYKVTPCGSAGPTGPTGAAGTLPVTASKSLGKAKKAKKGKSISVKVSSTAPVTNLSAKLKKASGKGATLASGKLAQLNGPGKLKLKFKKTLKKGKYLLIATGTVDGATLTAKLPAKLK